MPRTAADFRELARLNHRGTHSCTGACLAEVVAAFDAEARFDMQRLASALESQTLASGICLDGTWAWWADSPDAFAEQILTAYARLAEPEAQR